jgi:NAD(P)-dependent dehydrogenase (short-subunit alcohol dehydrogenase family)
MSPGWLSRPRSGPSHASSFTLGSNGGRKQDGSRDVKTWFITGTSRGFGREWAIAALDRGDEVAATARNLGTLDDLVAKYGDAIFPIELDVTDRGAAFTAVRQAHERFGRLDVVVNNAGYGQFGGRLRASARACRRKSPGSGSRSRWSSRPAASDNPPLRLFLGESPLRIAVQDYGSRLATWAQWQQVAAAAQGTQG